MGCENEQLLPSDPTGQRFCEWFNYRFEFIEARGSSPNGKPRWRTEKRYPIELRTLWTKYKDPETLIGLRFAPKTRYLMIDIDTSSTCHPETNAKKFKELLNWVYDLGLIACLIVISSVSGGIHLYFFLPEEVSSYYLALTVRKHLEGNSFNVRNGEIELFPNTKAYGVEFQGHRLPLQKGSYMVDENLNPISTSEEIDRFLTEADWIAQHQDIETLKEAIAKCKSEAEQSSSSKKSKKSKKSNKDRKEKDIEDWKRDLQAVLNQGWTGYHQTNYLLLQAAKWGVVFERIKEIEPLAESILEYALNAPGYSRWCRHQHEIWTKCYDVAKCVIKKNYWSALASYPDRKCNYKQLKSYVDRFRDVNAARQAKTLEKLTQAVEQLKAEGKYPCQVKKREEAINKKAKELAGEGISVRTLRKKRYKRLWHPSYDSSSVVEIEQEQECCVLQEEIQSKQPELEDLAPGITHIDVVLSKSIAETSSGQGFGGDPTIMKGVSQNETPPKGGNEISAAPIYKAETETSEAGDLGQGSEIQNLQHQEQQSKIEDFQNQEQKSKIQNLQHQEQQSKPEFFSTSKSFLALLTKVFDLLTLAIATAEQCATALQCANARQHGSIPEPAKVETTSSPVKTSEAETKTDSGEGEETELSADSGDRQLDAAKQKLEEYAAKLSTDSGDRQLDTAKQKLEEHAAKLVEQSTTLFQQIVNQPVSATVRLSLRSRTLMRLFAQSGIEALKEEASQLVANEQCWDAVSSPNAAGQVPVFLYTGEQCTQMVKANRVFGHAVGSVKQGVRVTLCYPQSCHVEHPFSICVRPIQGADNWLDNDGVAVLAEHLISTGEYIAPAAPVDTS